jgi:hypothetical protein
MERFQPNFTKDSRQWHIETERFFSASPATSCFKVDSDRCSRRAAR